MNIVMNLDSVKVLTDLHWLAREAEARCITDAEQWANELLFYAPEEWHKKYSMQKPVEQKAVIRSPRSARVIAFGKSLLRRREFHRAAFFLKEIKDESAFDRSLYYWARYLACEHSRLEIEAETIDRRIVHDHKDFTDLHKELCDLGIEHPEYFDVFLLYVLGKVRVSLKLKECAKSAFAECILRNRAMWPAWEELVYLVDSVEEISSGLYKEGNHWMFKFFEAEVFCRFNMQKNALEHYEKLSEFGFGDMPYVINQVAALFNSMQEHDMALEFFEKVRRRDPLRIERMRLYSDSLYVRGMRTELATLAHSFFKTHKFNWETCCIVANYYSLRHEHDKAVVFLQRSLRVNPNNSSAWTLIGHEFMEQKNNSAACLAYRKAIDADSHDFRGWYGLGQLYDILKMPLYSCFYYQQAHKCRPDDSRMLVALGEVYLRSGRLSEAQKCFLKAFKVGDVEGTALMLLGRSYERREEEEQAALVYEKYLDVYGDESVNDPENIATCCCYLARYYINKRDLDTATPFAQRCLEYDSTKEEGRNFLRQISQIRHRSSILVNVTEAPTLVTPIIVDSRSIIGELCHSPTGAPDDASATTIFRTIALDDCEADMIISSDDDSESPNTSL